MLIEVMKSKIHCARVTEANLNYMGSITIDEDLMDYYRLADLSLTVADDFDDVCREPVYQMMLGCRPADHEALLRGTSGVKIAVSWERAADVIPVSSGKGTSIAKILSYFNLEPAQAMAFGDSYNDIDMHKWKEYSDIYTDSLWIVEKRDNSVRRWRASCGARS